MVSDLGTVLHLEEHVIDERVYHRKVIRITAEDSPNVKRYLDQLAAGVKPDRKQVVDGVLSADEYKHRLATWDEQRKTVGLWGQFYEGKEVRLWPSDVLIACIQACVPLRGMVRRATGIGIDTAEGGDATTMTAGDELGILEVLSRKTPNTDVICGEVIAFGNKWGCSPRSWLFDAGGGGKQHCDRLRGLGFPCETVPFGGRPSTEIKSAMTLMPERKDVKEDQYVYVNMRAEMYHRMALGCEGEDGWRWSVPDNSDALKELHRQMSLIPKVAGEWSMWDPEGRIRMLPKNKKKPDSDELTLIDVIGHSPDELDSAVLCYHAVFRKRHRAKAGVG